MIFNGTSLLPQCKWLSCHVMSFQCHRLHIKLMNDLDCEQSGRRHITAVTTELIVVRLRFESRRCTLDFIPPYPTFPYRTNATSNENFTSSYPTDFFEIFSLATMNVFHFIVYIEKVKKCHSYQNRLIKPIVFWYSCRPTYCIWW